MKKLLLSLLILFVSTGTSFAFSPKSACHYLDSISGLSTSGWKYDGYEYYACSQYKMLDSYRSNLAYYAEGSSSNARKIYLVLNFYYGSNKVSMHNSLIQASKLLSKKSINYTLPTNIISCLQNGNTGSWKHGRYLISVTKEFFPSGKGYEIHFNIEE